MGIRGYLIRCPRREMCPGSNQHLHGLWKRRTKTDLDRDMSNAMAGVHKLDLIQSGPK